MLRGAFFQLNGFGLLNSIARGKAACDVVGIGRYCEGQGGLVELRIGAEVVEGEYEGLELAIPLVGGEAGAGRGLADQGLAVDFDAVHPEDADHDVDEHGTDGEDDNDGDDGAALVVVLGLAADSPEKGVGEEVEDI